MTSINLLLLALGLLFQQVRAFPVDSTTDQIAWSGDVESKRLKEPTDVIPEGANIIRYEWNATVEIRNIDGNYRQIFLLNGQSPGPAIEGDQGDWVIIKVNNYSPVPITIHFHGIRQRNTQFSDGVPGVTQWPILSGDTYLYVFKLEQHGLFWYHNHYRGYINDGLNGAIYIRPDSSVPRPYHDILSTEEEVSLLLELEKEPQYLLFTDLFKDSYDILASKLFGYGMQPTCVRTLLTNGKGRHLCYNADLIRNESHLKFDKLAKILGLKEEVHIDNYGCFDLLEFNGFTSIDYDKRLLEFPGYNDNDCTNATTNREIIYSRNQTHILFNILNLGAESSKVMSIDDHNITVIAVDGNYVTPRTGQQLYLPIGQRITAIVETKPENHDDVSKPFAIRVASNDLPQILEGLSFLVYDVKSGELETKLQSIDYPDNGVIYQDRAGTLVSSESYNLVDPRNIPPFDQSLRPPSGPADKTVYLFLNRTSLTTYTVKDDIPMNGGMEMDHPVLFTILNDTTRSINLTELISPVFIDEGIQKGDIVDIIFQNSLVSNDHPMHLHGHTFWIIAHNDSIDTFAYSSTGEALEDGREDLFDFEHPAFVDNVSIMTGGYAIIRLIADNPGAWMIHCHIQTHLSAGMGAVLIEAKEDIPDIPYSLFGQAHVNYNSKYGQTPSELNVTII